MSEEQKPTIINQNQPTQTWFGSWFDTTTYYIKEAVIIEKRKYLWII
jgi:hypothetical protein